MSIIPINGINSTNLSNPFSLHPWNPFNSHDDEIWNPFSYLNFPSSPLFPSVFSSSNLQTQINWRETHDSHVFKAYFPGLTKDDVIVFMDDENMLQICTTDNKFFTRFKMPDNVRTDEVKACMEDGFLVVSVAKQGLMRSNVRVVEITE